jgi:hypothetical protein
MAKLTAAQVRTLKEIVDLHRKGFRKFSCVTNYKPATKLVELGLVKVTNDDKFTLILVPTPEGEAEAVKHPDEP